MIPLREEVLTMRCSVAILAIATACLWGCGGSSSSAASAKTAGGATQCATPDIALTLVASETVNPSEGGEGRPVQVRIYQLKSDDKLRSAMFEEIWREDAAVLKDDLVKVDERTVFPGKSELVNVKPAPEVRKIAAVALFRQPQGTDWFVAYAVPGASDKGGCTANVSFSAKLDRMQIREGEQKSSSATK